MPINPLSVPNFGGPFSGGADFAPLGNLGNVMQAQQDRQRQLAALGQLGTDPTQNAMAFIKSGDPRMAQQGVEMLNQITTQQRQQALLNIQQQHASLEQKKFEAEQEQQSDAYRKQQLIDAGLDPESPEGRTYRVTGQNFPAPSKETAQDRAAIRAADAQTEASRVAIQNIDHMETLRQQSIHFPVGTETVGHWASYLPEGWGGTAGKATEELKNEALIQMMGNVKAAFGSQPSNREDAWMREAQAAGDKSSEVQKDILSRGRKIMLDRYQYNLDQANQMRAGTLYKPGGGPKSPPPSPEATGETTTPPKSTPTSETSLPSSDWMTRARKANPGMSDSELVSNWKKKHPNG